MLILTSIVDILVLHSTIEYYCINMVLCDKKLNITGEKTKGVCYLPEGEEKLIQEEFFTLRALFLGKSVDCCHQYGRRSHNYRVAEVDRRPRETCAEVGHDTGVLACAIGWDLSQQTDASLRRERDISGSDSFSISCHSVEPFRKHNFTHSNLQLMCLAYKGVAVWNFRCSSLKCIVIICIEFSR